MPPAPPRLLLVLLLVLLELGSCYLRPLVHHSPSTQHKEHCRSFSLNRPMATAGAGGGGDGDAQQHATIHEPASLNPRAEDYSIMAAKLQNFDKGWVFPPQTPGGPARVAVKRNVRDIDRDRTRSFLLQMQFESEEGAPRWVPGASALPLDMTGTVAISPSGNRTLVFKEEEGKNGDKSVLAEVWSASALRKTLRLEHAHSAVNGDGWFGAFTWSPDESTVAYVAQAQPAKKRVSAFDFGGTSAGGSSDGGNVKKGEKEKGEEDSKFEYQEDWGEKFENFTDLGLFLLSLHTGRVARVAGVPPDITPGGPLLSADGSHLVYIGWDDKPRRLGMIYCYQRPCRIYAANVAQLTAAINNQGNSSPPPPSMPHVCLTPGEKLARAPAFSRDGSKLAYLGSVNAFETHNGPMALRVLDWSAVLSGTPPHTLPRATLVDEVPHPSSSSSSSSSNEGGGGQTLLGFPGLWADGLLRDCWAPDDSAIYVTSAWGSRNVLLRVSLVQNAQGGVGGLKGQVERLPVAAEAAGSGGGGASMMDASVSLLAVSPSGLLVAGSACNNPGGLGMLSLDGKALRPAPPLDAAAVSSSLYCPDRFAHLSSQLQRVQWRILPVLPPGDPISNPPFEAILLLPPPSGAPNPPPPLVVVPHGGPHSCTPTSFSHAYAFLCVSYGFAVLHVNYRGSTGFGGAALESLAGNVGTNDVDDVHQATQAALQLRDPGSDQPVVDPTRVGIVGGSHGGFLGAHAIAAHPELYKVAALRNPVTNIPSMTTATDIPDWAFVEALGLNAYDFSTFKAPAAEQLARMWAASPISRIDSVRAPTLIALGKRDRRVPFTQGLEYFHALRARSVPAKLLIYEQDVHAIDRPVSEADHWLQIGRWLEEHI